MKLYRIRYKDAFVTRLKTEETLIDQPSPAGLPEKIVLMPGVPIEVCEMIAAHWAEKRVEVPAHDQEIKTMKPGWWEHVAEVIPGYWETQTKFIEGHYETQEIWIPEHIEQELQEIPGYFEERRVQGPGHWEIQNIWVPEYTVTRYYWREAHPERGLEAAWIPYDEVIPAGYKDKRIWVEGRWVRKEFWVDTTWEQVDVVVPGQYRDHRVWIDGNYEDVNVWVPAKTVPKPVWHPPEEVITIVAVPLKVERQPYWQEEYEKCWMTKPDQQFIAGVQVTPEYMQALGDWFAWYQTTGGGQLFLQGAQSYGWLEDWTNLQVMHKAFELYRGFQPDVTARLAPDVTMKIPESEIRKILPHIKKIPHDPMSVEEIEWLWGAAAKAALLAAAAYLVYYTWPGAKFDFRVTYSEWTYVLRYQEQFQYANIVGVSPKGKPTYYACTQWGGPIMGEERSREKDIWHFGEEWQWSAYVEEGRWMGIGETRHWYEAEVEYIGMVSKSGASFYTLHDKITKDACAGHEPGWILPSREWEIIHEEWWHERI